MYFKIHRNVDSWRLRKVVIELYNDDGTLLDRRRCFAFPLFLFKRRLARKKERMLRCAAMMIDAMKKKDCSN